LGFAENQGPCSDAAIKSIEKYGVGTSSTPYELGTQRYTKELEKLMAEYLNVEDCIAFGMGFATNALNIPTLAGKVNTSSHPSKNALSLSFVLRMI
jgi:serine palmitoyltransferase